MLFILLYTSECWKMNQRLEKRILALENMCLRRILNISWQQRVSNIEIQNRTGQPLITAVLRKKRWSYLGHVLRMKEGRLPRTAYDWKPGGRRRRGRPKNTLRRTFDRDMRTAETSLIPELEDVTAAALLRDEWRGFVDAPCATNGSGGTKF
jgi:hypothetical protein